MSTDRATTTQNLAEALPQEIERCQDLVREYEALGPAGLFGATAIRMEIKQAIRAMASQDLIAMIQAYQALRDCE